MAEISIPAEKKTDAETAIELRDSNREFASGASLAALVTSLMLGMFLVALDNVSSFVAAVPLRLKANDLSKVSWYGAAYFMTFGGSE